MAGQGGILLKSGCCERFLLILTVVDLSLSRGIGRREQGMGSGKIRLCENPFARYIAWLKGTKSRRVYRHRARRETECCHFLSFSDRQGCRLMKSSHPSAVTTLCSVASLFCLAVCSSPAVHAQSNAPAGKAQLNSRPQSAVQQVKLSPELNLILTNWEKAGDITQRLEGKHRRYIYDFVFNVEKWSEGRILL